MADANPNDAKPLSAEGRFASTHWSVVLAAARTSSPEAQAALEKLCAAYWYPLYAYLRRRGHGRPDAQDYTQEFFTRHILTQHALQGIQPGAGRFRSWLLTCLQNLVHNEWEKAHAAKRGGGAPHLSLDFDLAEDRYTRELASELTPEKLYERSFALTLLGLAVAELGQEFAQEQKGELFAELRKFLPGAESGSSYAEVAARLGKSEDAIKMAVSRLRHRYGQLLRKEVGRTVKNPSEIDDELRALMTAVSS